MNIKQNPPWLNILIAYFLPWILLSIGLLFKEGMGTFAFLFVFLFAPISMTFGIYILMTSNHSPQDIMSFIVSLVLIVSLFSIGIRFTEQLWGQFLIVVGLWIWTFWGILGLAGAY